MTKTYVVHMQDTTQCLDLDSVSTTKQLPNKTILDPPRIPDVDITSSATEMNPLGQSNANINEHIGLSSITEKFHDGQVQDDEELYINLQDSTYECISEKWQPTNLSIENWSFEDADYSHPKDSKNVDDVVYITVDGFGNDLGKVADLNHGLGMLKSQTNKLLNILQNI